MRKSGLEQLNQCRFWSAVLQSFVYILGGIQYCKATVLVEPHSAYSVTQSAMHDAMKYIYLRQASFSRSNDVLNSLLTASKDDVSERCYLFLRLFLPFTQIPFLPQINSYLIECQPIIHSSSRMQTTLFVVNLETTLGRLWCAAADKYRIHMTNARRIH